MVVTNTILGDLISDILSKFDSYDYVGVGSGTNPESAADTTLQSETFREQYADKIKDDNNGTYLWSIQMGLTENNGNDINEIGVFDASSSGNMALRKLLSNGITKTSDKEVWIDVQVKVEVLNS